MWHMIDEIDLVGMVTDHMNLERLCDRLETVADALTWLPPSGIALQLSAELENRLPDYEDRASALLDRLFGGRLCAPSQTAALGRIRRRTGSHVVQAQDLAEALQPDAALLQPNMLGYMLRCFFEACRADMAFEELVILQFAGARLTPNARTLIKQSLEARCRK